MEVRMYIVTDDEIDERAREFLSINSILINPQYRIQLMILCVLGDIRKLLEPADVGYDSIKEEVENGNTDEFKHQD
jgi:hypothetical protein